MAHLRATDDNSLIGCTSHDSTDDWSQPMPISLTAYAHFAARLGAFFYRTRLFGPQCTNRAIRGGVIVIYIFDLMTLNAV